MERKVILYIAASLDGYIAKPGDNLDFLSIVEEEGEDYGYAQFIQSVDTVIMGRKTYDWVMNQVAAFPHADKEAYIITRTPRPGTGRLIFYTGDLYTLVHRLKSEPGKDIFCDEGAEVVHALLKADLIDEIIVSVIPVLVGDGIHLFREGRPEKQMHLISVKSFKTGLVQLHYSCRQAT